MQTSQPVEERKGALWDLYRDMKDSQWAVDARSYTTEFRVRPTPELSSPVGRSAQSGHAVPCWRNIVTPRKLRGVACAGEGQGWQDAGDVGGGAVDAA